jgi:hypothetical protein
VIDWALVGRLLQSALSLYAAVYLLSAFGLPAWFLKTLSLNELDRRKVSKWRVWTQGAVTVIGVGVLVYSASYALIAAIPYSWGGHDEDGDWQSTRDWVRGVITFIGAIYLSFSMDKIAEALIWQRIERKARASLLTTLVQTYCVPADLLEAAITNLKRDLKIDEYARRDWGTEQQERFTHDLVAQLQHTAEIRRPRT